jgi:hypothetical protein
MVHDENNGWDEWRNHVLLKLKDLGDDEKETQRQIKEIGAELMLLKLKSSLWGGFAGLGVYAMTMAMEWLKRRP